MSRTELGKRKQKKARVEVIYEKYKIDEAEY
jgi:hypothetical protein